MFTIAGGIILAVLFLALLPFLASVAFYALLALAAVGIIAFAVWQTMATWPTDPATVLITWGVLALFIGFIAIGQKDHRRPPPSAP